MARPKREPTIVLEVAEKRFNHKTLVTEANLKKIGILSERVGTISKYYLSRRKICPRAIVPFDYGKKFRNCNLVESSSEDDNEDINEEKGGIYSFV